MTKDFNTYEYTNNRKTEKNGRSKTLPFRIFLKLKLKKLLAFKKICFLKSVQFVVFLPVQGQKILLTPNREAKPFKRPCIIHYLLPIQMQKYLYMYSFPVDP